MTKEEIRNVWNNQSAKKLTPLLLTEETTHCTDYFYDND